MTCYSLQRRERDKNERNERSGNNHGLHVQSWSFPIGTKFIGTHVLKLFPNKKVQVLVFVSHLRKTSSETKNEHHLKTEKD